MLAEEIARDQRAYALALEGAEHSEHASLSSVMEIEKRWSLYTFDWVDMDPEVLAGRIVEFELERDRRRELFPYSDYRDMVSPSAATGRAGGRGAAREGTTVPIGMVVVGLILAIIVIGIVVAIL